MATLAIKGHATRGKEVVEILAMLGGRCKKGYSAGGLDCYYYISDNGTIDNWYYLDEDCFITFTLEEFLEKFPYKVVDKAIAFGNNCVIIGAVWDESINEVVYRIRIDETEYTTTKLSSQLQPYKEQETMEETIKIDIPKGYEFAGVDNQQVVFEKIGRQYPKTYEECCVVLGTDCENLCLGYAEDLLDKLQSLLICRDAYWKIVGEQMGLGKPWEPDWNNDTEKYVIYPYQYLYSIDKENYRNTILAFPTEEMRDIFYENFMDLIDICRELL